MSESSDLVAKLKASHKDVQQYVDALKAENAKLHKRIAQLEAENVSLENRITAIKDFSPLPVDQVDRSQLLENAIQHLRDAGYTVTKNN